MQRGAGNRSWRQEISSRRDRGGLSHWESVAGITGESPEEGAESEKKVFHLCPTPAPHAGELELEDSRNSLPGLMGIRAGDGEGGRGIHGTRELEGARSSWEGERGGERKRAGGGPNLSGWGEVRKGQRFPILGSSTQGQYPSCLERECWCLVISAPRI